MYPSFLYNQYDSYCYSEMNKSLDGGQQSEFRGRSQTWAGNEVNCHSQMLQISPSEQYTCFFESLNSNEDSINSIPDYSVQDKPDDKSDTKQTNTVAKKTSRKNPWGQETYADLIESAIDSKPSKMATLQQIYDHISKSHAYFMERSDPVTSAGWKNSIRHNLSLHDKFLKCPKKNENTKSSLWTINQNGYKRSRSNSMDCNNNKRHIVTKRRHTKEQLRSSARNSNIISAEKRSIRSPRIEEDTTPGSFPVDYVSSGEVSVQKSPEFLELNTESKYMPPDIAPNTMICHREYSLHENLGKLGMNSMEPIYNSEDEYRNYGNSEIPDFQLAAMEYSIFVAELFNE